MSYSKEYGYWRNPSLSKYLMQAECLYENKIHFQNKNLSSVCNTARNLYFSSS